tara:strand:+ start:6695 stop:6934 length:240 start_codon:yes stop_codon:yes gene_type:complete
MSDKDFDEEVFDTVEACRMNLCSKMKDPDDLTIIIAHFTYELSLLLGVAYDHNSQAIAEHYRAIADFEEDEIMPEVTVH